MELLRPKIRVTESSSTYAELSLEPLERGYGMTLGNSLRRMLLSSIRGAAITAVRISGVLHEFSTIPGVREDVIEILMNLKHISVLSRSTDIKTLRIEVDGPCDVRTKHIQPDSEVEFIDPEAKICTLGEGGHLEIDLYIEHGVGYVSNERPKPVWLPIDALLVDAIYSPVLRVNYEVEAARVGQRTDFERLLLHVWTNGIITPEMATREASKILEGYFNYLVSDLAKFCNIVDEPDILGSSSRSLVGSHERDMLLSRSVKELELSIRSENCLMRGGIRTVAELVRNTREDLLKIRNLGKVSLVEIIDKLQSAGLNLKSSNKEMED